MDKFTLPDCSTWRIWEGPEIEGEDQRGEMTLFVRDGNFWPYLNAKDYKRVWFCKEFTDYMAMNLVAVRGIKVAYEVTPDTISHVPNSTRSMVTLYLKIEADYLRDGDHVCIGTAFRDEAFKMGKGQKVYPDQYSQDVRFE